MAVCAGDSVIHCEVIRDVPADDELVAMLTVAEAAAAGPGVSASPSVVTEPEAGTSAPRAAAAAGEAESPSLSPPVKSVESPAPRSDDADAARVSLQSISFFAIDDACVCQLVNADNHRMLPLVSIFRQTRSGAFRTFVLLFTFCSSSPSHPFTLLSSASFPQCSPSPTRHPKTCPLSLASADGPRDALCQSKSCQP